MAASSSFPSHGSMTSNGPLTSNGPVASNGPVSFVGSVNRVAAYEAASQARAPHFIEREVRQLLSTHPRLQFSNLVVRRVGEGVCLTGVLESNEAADDVCGLVRQVVGVQHVMNRLITRPAMPS